MITKKRLNDLGHTIRGAYITDVPGWRLLKASELTFKNCWYFHYGSLRWCRNSTSCGLSFGVPVEPTGNLRRVRCGDGNDCPMCPRRTKKPRGKK